jgi:type VI secretion system protein ImpF
MSDRDKTRRLVSSMIDRLTESSGGARLFDPDELDVDQLKRNVARDLEDLLNTRRRCEELPAGVAELENSLVTYGLPDFTGLNMSAPREIENARLEMERVIRRFEPRLKNVVVEMQANVDPAGRTLRLRITGTLRLEPEPERVVFDSELEPSTAAVAIELLR